MPAFPEIFDTHQHLVFNLCLHYLQNRHDAEEAAQDVFVKVHAKLPDFQEKSSLKTWIYRIAINHCLDILKSRRRQKRFAYVLNLLPGQGDSAHDPPDFDHPGVLLEDREALENLFQKINELPENQKTALILRYLDDLPPPEIADIMRCSVKAVESLLQRGKNNLEKKLGGGEGN